MLRAFVDEALAEPSSVPDLSLLSSPKSFSLPNYPLPSIMAPKSEIRNLIAQFTTVPQVTGVDLTGRNVVVTGGSGCVTGFPHSLLVPRLSFFREH